MSSLSEATNEVETKEKNAPTKNSKRIIDKIDLSKFFHQL